MEDDEDGEMPWGTMRSTSMTLFDLAFTGNIEREVYPSERYDIVALLYLFIIVISVILLSILIAIVSDSYDDAMANAIILFWASRLEAVMECYMSFGDISFMVPEVMQASANGLLLRRVNTAHHEGRKKVGRTLDIVNRIQKNTHEEMMHLKRELMEHTQKEIDDMKEHLDPFL